MDPIMQALLARMSPMNGAPQPPMGGASPASPIAMRGSPVPLPGAASPGQSAPPGYINPVLLHQLLENKR